MSGVLTFSQYLGGPDELQIKQVFPSDQSTLIYNFFQDITGFTFSADQQTIIVDELQFKRSTGEPNFTNSRVIGTFPYAPLPSGFQPEILDAEKGLVTVYLPAGLYTGPIIPDARKNVPITIVSLTWQDARTPPTIKTSRWALVQSWEPEVDPGDPVLSQDFSEL
jgi:hypothetical protein